MTSPLIAAFDVDYRDPNAVAASVWFNAWTANRPIHEFTTTIHNVAPYESGSFYKRELPCLLQALANAASSGLTPDLIIVDSYVWLGDSGTDKGLGAHLYDALSSRIPVIGVAKTHFRLDRCSIPITRGQSTASLYITAAGIDLAQAAAHIQSMHGPFRVPTLLRHVDSLCRRL